MPTLNGTNFSTLFGGTNGGSGTTYTNAPNLGAGVISGSSIGTNTSNLASKTNALLVGDLVVTNTSNGSYFYGSAAADYVKLDENGNVFATGGITFGGNLYGSGASLTNIGTNSMSQAAHEFYAGGGSSSTNFVATTNSEWALFGMSFNGGQADWPPVNAEEKGLLMYSSDGVNWVGGSGYSQLTGVSGYVRDPALIQVGSMYGLSYTTNQSYAPLGSKSFPILVSSNLTHWTHITNISMLLAGESDTGTNTLHWSPVLTVVGTNVWLFGSVTTNGTASFKQRYRTTSVANFPYGWSATAEMNNGTGLTNIIDLTPYVHTNGTVYAWYKNESAGSCDLGVFASADPSSAFTTVISAPFGASVEGNWMVQLPNGRYRVYMVRYLYGTTWAGYGNNGAGQVLSFAESASITSGWSSLTNAITPFYAQSFKPILVRDTRTHTHAVGATVGSMGLRGVVSIKGYIGRGTTGLSQGGFAFENPNPNPHPTGLNTNDYAAINFGDENRSRGGLYARGDGTVRMYVPTFTSTDTNIALGWVKDVVTARSNRFDIAVPLYVEGVLMTNGGGGSAMAGTVTNNYTPELSLLGNMKMTNSALNAPSFELFSLASPSGGNLGPYLKMGAPNSGSSQTWSMGFAMGTGSNSLLFNLGESPYTHIFKLWTNGRAGINIGTELPAYTLDVGGDIRIRSGSFIGNGASLTNAGTMSANTNAFASLKDAATIATTAAAAAAGGAAARTNWGIGSPIVNPTTQAVIDRLPYTWTANVNSYGVKFDAAYDESWYSPESPIGYRTNIVTIYAVTTNAATTAWIVRFSLVDGSSVYYNATSPAGTAGYTNMVSFVVTNSTGTAWTLPMSGMGVVAVDASATKNVWVIGGKQMWIP
jgi:hypothetical protein